MLNRIVPQPRWMPALLGLALALTFTGCGNPASQSGAGSPDGPLQIVATTGMVRDLVENIAGDHAEVTGLMGSGVDPHLYKPTRSDLTAVLGADAVFYSGLMLEGRMADAFMQAGRDGVKVYPVTERIDESFLLEPEGFGGHWDPHVWMDVQAWSQCIKVVTDALSKLDPEHAQQYEANAEAYRAKLTELNQYVQRVIETVPEESRVLVTAHDAFNYFGRAYGIEVLGIQGISTESEAGLEDINRLVDMLVERNIQAVFVETSVSDRNVRALMEGAANRGHTVKIGGELFSDAMGPKGTYEDTYIGMIDHNATLIARGLGGEAPRRGMNSKLSVE